MVDPPNLLLMDEPTTHLDIPSIDALVSALKTFAGTFIFISHDVYFIRQLAETVLHVHSGRLTPYAGNYDYYLDKSKATNAREALTAGFTSARPDQTKSAAKSAAPKVDRATAKAQQAKLRELRTAVSDAEKRVVELEEKQAELTAELEEPATYEEAGKAQHLNRELTAISDQLSAANQAWEAAATHLEAAS